MALQEVGCVSPGPLMWQATAIMALQEVGCVSPGPLMWQATAIMALQEVRFIMYIYDGIVKLCWLIDWYCQFACWLSLNLALKEFIFACSFKISD